MRVCIHFCTVFSSKFVHSVCPCSVINYFVITPLNNTETALEKMTREILMACDSGLHTILIFLNLIAATETISYSILLSSSSPITH